MQPVKFTVIGGRCWGRERPTEPDSIYIATSNMAGSEIHQILQKSTKIFPQCKSKVFLCRSAVCSVVLRHANVRGRTVFTRESRTHCMRCTPGTKVPLKPTQTSVFRTLCLFICFGGKRCALYTSEYDTSVFGVQMYK